MSRISASIALSVAFILQSGCETTPSRNPLQTGPEVNSVAELQTKLGTGYLREGHYELAWSRLDKALRADPKYSTAHNAMALLYERLGQPEYARRHYSLAVKYNPSDSSAHTNYGSFLCRQGEVEEAEQEFQQAVANPLYPTPEIPYTNLGLCLHQAGEAEKAEGYLRQALDINPRIPGALLVMSDLSYRGGQELSARAYMQRYIEISSHSPRTLWLGVRIERSLGDLDAAASYAMLLKNNYPDSSEARLLLESESQW